jgi:hypothetical protein
MFLLAVVLVIHGIAGFGVRAEVSDQPAEPQPQLFSQGELDLLLGPIALYPDPLIAVLLPAATQSSEVVLAARFLDRVGDYNAIEQQQWSDSVKALAYYPEVLRWMDENLEWTRQVGEAFLNQPEDVMATIQRLRAMAQSLGNLQTTPQQIVEVSDGEIDILPADPDMVYVPAYEPRPVYTQPGARVWFANGARTGAWLKHDWDWQNKRVIVWTRDSARPRNWWSQPRSERFRADNKFQEWCPRTRAGQFPCKFWATRWQQNAKTHGAASNGSTSTHQSVIAHANGFRSAAHSMSAPTTPRNGAAH